MVNVQDILARIEGLPFTEDQKRAVRIGLPTLDISKFSSTDDFDIIEYLNSTLDLQRLKPGEEGEFAIFIDPNPVTRWGYAYFDCTAIRVKCGTILGHAELSFSQVNDVANQIYQLSSKTDLPDVPSRIKWPLSHLTKSREERRHWMWLLLTELFNSPIPNDERFRSAQLLRDLIDDPVTQMHKDVYTSVRKAMKGQSHRGRQNRSLQVILSTPAVANKAAIGLFADTGDGELTLFRKFTDLDEAAFDDVLDAVYRHMEDYEYHPTRSRDEVTYAHASGRGLLITFRRHGAFKLKEAAALIEEKVKSTGKAVRGAVEHTQSFIEAQQGALANGGGHAAITQGGPVVSEVDTDSDEDGAPSGHTRVVSGASASASASASRTTTTTTTTSIAKTVVKELAQNEQVRQLGATVVKEVTSNPEFQQAAEAVAGQVAGQVTEIAVDKAKQHLATAAVSAVTGS